MRYHVSRVLGVVLLPAIIFLLGVLPLVSPFIAFFLLLLFIIKPTEEVRKAPVSAALWVIFILPLLIMGFGAPFRSLTLIMGALFKQSLTFWSAESRWLIEPLPGDLGLGIIGAIIAGICGSFAMATLRTQRQQLANIATATARSAAIGLAEFKGTARLAKGPAHRMRVETFHPGEPGIPDDIPEDRILQSEERWTGNAIGHRKMWRTFSLEDGTGRILIDPLGVEFWKGYGSPYFEPFRKIHLSKRVERTFMNPLAEETRWLKDGDPITVIGSVEMNPDAPSNAAGAGRLVIRPSTELKRPGLIERFVLPNFIGKELVPGRRYDHLFYLSDVGEDDLAMITKKAERRVIFWTLAWLGLSLWCAMQGWLKAQGRL